MTWLSDQQFAGFQRAARRRSRGQVTIPDVRLSLAEATALWTDIRAAFGPATGRDLAPQELGHLRRRAWRRSSGFASLSALSMSLEAAHAFWHDDGLRGGQFSQAGKVQVIVMSMGDEHHIDGRQVVCPHARMAQAFGRAEP